MNTYLNFAESMAKALSDFKIIIIAAFIIMNITAFILFYVDKQKAKKHLWRIPEATLLLFSFLGGSIGGLASMKIFRHKTKHPKFYILVPLFLILHLIFIITWIIGIF